MADRDKSGPSVANSVSSVACLLARPLATEIERSPPRLFATEEVQVQIAKERLRPPKRPKSREGLGLIIQVYMRQIRGFSATVNFFSPPRR